MSLGKPKFDPQKPFDKAQDKHHRRSIRLKRYDYSQNGAYYVTVVTYQRDCLFGDIANGEMILNDLGKIADECWRAIPEHFPFVELGAFVIMPNHVHGIITITHGGRGTIYRAPTREQFQKPVTGSIPTIVRTFKAAVTRHIGREHNATGIWQRNYYEHIIRDEKELQNKTDYITANPSMWDKDNNNQKM
jgi:putative transposase